MRRQEKYVTYEHTVHFAGVTSLPHHYFFTKRAVYSSDHGTCKKEDQFFFGRKLVVFLEHKYLLYPRQLVSIQSRPAQDSRSSIWLTARERKTFAGALTYSTK